MVILKSDYFPKTSYFLVTTYFSKSLF